MYSLTLNYVSQIERLFTFEQMLTATGQNADQARPEWDELQKNGRLVEVKGAGQRYFRYRRLPKPKEASPKKPYDHPHTLRMRKTVNAIWLHILKDPGHGFTYYKPANVSRRHMYAILAALRKSGYITHKRGCYTPLRTEQTVDIKTIYGKEDRNVSA